MPPTQPTSLRRTRTRTRTRRFIPTPCIHTEARPLNHDILLQIVEKASATTISHEMAQGDNRADINQVTHQQPQQTHPDNQIGQADSLFERWGRAVETQKELSRWINGVKNEREKEEVRRVYDEALSQWEDLGEVYREERGWYILAEREGGVLVRWRLKRRGVIRLLGGVV